jgi:DNA-binding response OmpR family regulator
MSHVLIVDDEDSITELLGKIVEMSGHRCSVANDGDKAIAFCRRSEPNVAIVDILMPNKGGLETIVELKRDHPRLKIVAVSGGGYDSPKPLLKWAAKMGADRVFGKPFAAMDVMSSVSDLLREQEREFEGVHG